MSLFGLFNRGGSENDVKEYLEKGAVVLDVRTLQEWNEGHVEGSKHIVLTIVPLKIDEIKAFNKPVIVVCKSGGRAGQAVQFLSKQGIDAINGGAWQNVAQFVS